MKNKILKKMISLMLAFVLLINLIPRSTYAQDNFITIDGYKIEILEDSGQRTVAKLEVDGQTYTMTHNMFENDYTLEKQTNEKNIFKSVYCSSGTVEQYKVNVETFNEGELVASVENVNDKSDTLKIDETSDNIKAQATLVVGTGAAAAANRLRSGGDVFAISSGYAYDACKSASPIKKVSKPQKHGSGSNYYKHYHPMLTAKKQSKAHCFFI